MTGASDWLRNLRRNPPISFPTPISRSDNDFPDWAFIVPQAARGWILDAICREIGQRLRQSWDVYYSPKYLPKARVYFFAHYSNYLDHLSRSPNIAAGRTLVWFTHPRETVYEEKDQVAAFNKATQILFTCSLFRNEWLAKGVSPDRCTVVLGGADPRLFKAHRRGQGVVGLSSSFYARKNPEALLDLVKLLPHRRFRLIGRNWEQYARFYELRQLPNFEYITADYGEYPQVYQGFDVFVSLASLEGGPIPLLETMMCNAVPVASNTGFASDLIVHGRNGYIFEVGTQPSDIAALVEQAFTMRGDIRNTVKRYNWDNFSRNVRRLGNS